MDAPHYGLGRVLLARSSVSVNLTKHFGQVTKIDTATPLGWTEKVETCRKGLLLYPLNGSNGLASNCVVGGQF
jgi:hypothetical protein